MPQANRTDPMQLFSYHACIVCAIAVLTLTLDAADPNNATAPIVLMAIAAMIRWSGVETTHGDDAGLAASAALDTGLGLMAADILAFWI